MKTISRIAVVCAVASALSFAAPAQAKTKKALDIYFVDVEGGQATLIVTPAGQSMLVDTGWAGFEGRDADRIADAAKRAGISKIDYVWITHYHSDHVGGVPALVQKMKVGAFIDHGDNQEHTDPVNALYAAYAKAIGSSKHIVIKPGDHVPLKGVTIEALTANGEHVAKPLPGGGQANANCSVDADAPVDPTENARSAGFLLTYGKFRFLDLGDLTKKKEIELACPKNPIGTVDVYLTTHHGLFQSNSKAIVDAVAPRVAIMNNGAKKGGSPPAWQTIHDSPRLEDLWQLHYSIEGAKEHNTSEQLIANPDEKCTGQFLKLSAQSDGSFSVWNSRNDFSKNYAAKK
jgi:beta-lactamase superfamily II metal-dependent hydrolase